MYLESQFPWVISQQQAGHLLIGEYGYAVTLTVIGLVLHLGDGVLPAVQEHGATGAVGYYEIGLVGLHRFKFLLGVGYGVSAVFLNQILAESESAAVTALGVIDNLTAPGLYHAGQYVGEFGLTYALVGEYLGIVATYVLHNLKRLAGETVDQTVFHLLGQLVAEVVYHVRRVSNVLGYVELSLAGLVEVFAGLLQKFGMFLPHVYHFGEDAE